MKKIFLFALIFNLILSSCDLESVVDLEIPPHESLLVLTGVLDTDTNVQVTISNSVGAFDNTTPYFITDAHVLLYKDDQFVDSLLPDLENPIWVEYYNSRSFQSSSLPMYYYKTDSPPVKDAVYRIEVDHPSYPSVSADTYIPQDITLYNIDIDTITNPDKIGFTFSFDDNADKQNYYRLKLFTSCHKKYVDEYGYNGTWYFDGQAWMMSNDPSFPGGIPFDGYTFEGQEVVFNDALFNGQQKTISLDVSTEFKEGLRLDYGDCDTVIVQFSTFSEDTYSYFNSLGDHREKGPAGIFGGETVPVYTNVDNGLGVIISVNAQDVFLKP